MGERHFLAGGLQSFAGKVFPPLYPGIAEGTRCPLFFLPSPCKRGGGESSQPGGFPVAKGWLPLARYPLPNGALIPDRALLNALDCHRASIHGSHGHGKEPSKAMALIALKQGLPLGFRSRHERHETFAHCSSTAAPDGAEAIETDQNDAP